MTRDDIIRMAREANAYAIEKLPYGKYQPDRPDVRDLHFAALVAAEVAKCGGCGKAGAEGWALYCVKCCEQSMVNAAIAEEREACARLVEEIPYPQPRVAGHQLRGHDYLAAAIRARGEK